MREDALRQRDGRPLRVLIAHSRYLSGAVSGENRVVDDEVRLLRNAGHDVAVHDPCVETSSKVDLVRAAASAVWSRESMRVLTGLVRAHRPDVLHFHNLLPALSPAVLRVGRRSNVPVFVTLHNYRLLCLPGTFMRNGRTCEDCLGKIPWRGAMHRCYRGSVAASASYSASLSLHRALGSFDNVSLYLAVSEFVRTKYVAAGFPPERLVVKPNFSWPTQRRRGPGDYFLFLGRLSSEKGVSILLRAWRPEYGRLLVVGDGPDLPSLRAGGVEGVEFRDSVPPDEAARLLRNARALLLPALSYEGSPRTVAEAAAAAVPVIASRIGAVGEAVEHGTSGFLVPPTEADAWSAAIRTLLDDGESLRLGDGSHQLWQRRYSPAGSLDALERIYRHVGYNGFTPSSFDLRELP
jgi:glycosyltransferase involved in cell wall biosynthesis